MTEGSRVAETPTIELSDDETGRTWRLFAAGDCALDIDRTGAVIDDAIADRIDRADFALANLEAPVPVDAERIEKSGPALTTAAGTPDHLADAGFDLLTLANNHLMDYGRPGLTATTDACDDAGLTTCGAGEDRMAALAPARETIGDTEVAVLSVCEREFGVATRTDTGTAPAGHRDTLAAVRDATATAETVIVVAHGGVEYVPLPSRARRERLREFAAAGADLVVGHHPHVAQGWEVYDGVPIFPSLGNFAFDRQSTRANTARGLALEVRFDGSQLADVTLVPTRLAESVEPVEARRAAAFRQYLSDAAAVLGDDDAFDAHWQTVACQLFYERYSNWLLTGVGETLSQARANPTDPAAQRPHWDPERRRTELLTLLNVVRNESHRDVLATALGVLSGATRDRRTDSVTSAVESLREWTNKE